MVVEVSLRFEFPITNNQVEYEALIVRITLSEEMGVNGIRLRKYSQLAISQKRKETHANDPLLQWYL